MLSKIESSLLTFKICKKVSEASYGENEKISREIARKSTKEIYEKLLYDLGINVSINFSDESKKNFKNEVIALQKYIETGEISKDLSLLFLGNHQSFGFEALGAYNIFPTNGRILLKDTLTKIPFFGKGIKSLNPIIFDRKLGLTKENTKKRNHEIKETIIQQKSVLIYPEGTRSKDGKLQDLYSSLYSEAVKTILESDNIKNKTATIITSKTNDVFPDTLEKTLFCLSNIKKGEIKFIIDFIDLQTFKSIKEINETVREIISQNL